MDPVTLPAYAKINLDLRILGVRPDGFHDVRTILQSLALHDTLTFVPRKGRFAIHCDDPAVPTDHRNLIWTAASLLWRTVGRRRGDRPRDVVVELRKQIPAEAGLGGGSANAAMTLLGLARLWELDVDAATLSRLASHLGADVPFFLVGGTALGIGRGDDISPLAEPPRCSVVVVRPGFGIATAEAYDWFDRERRPQARERARRTLAPGWPEWARNLRNDLEPIVTAHHPTIARIKTALIDAGAFHAAMSGSGSTVFGLFERHDAAIRTARDLARPGWHVVATRTLGRSEYARRVRLRRPRAAARQRSLAAGRKSRIS